MTQTSPTQAATKSKSILVLEPQPWYGAELSRQWVESSVNVFTASSWTDPLLDHSHQLIVWDAQVAPDETQIRKILTNDCLLIIVVTQATDAQIHQWLHIGASAVLKRPVSCEELQMTVQPLMKEKTA